MKVYFMSLLFIFFSFCARDFLSLILLILFYLIFFWFPIIFFVSLFFNHSPHSFYLKIKSSVWAFLPLIFLVFRSIYQVDYFYASFEAVFLLFFSHFPFVYRLFCRFCYVFRIALKSSIFVPIVFYTFFFDDFMHLQLFSDNAVCFFCFISILFLY